MNPLLVTGAALAATCLAGSRTGSRANHTTTARLTRFRDRLGIPDHAARKAIDLVYGDADPLDYPGAASYERQCYHPPGRDLLVLYALNDILDGLGVEGVCDQETGRKGASWVETGDSYNTTVILYTGRPGDSRWTISSVGDEIEAGRIPGNWS